RIAANFQSKLQGEASTQALIKEARQFLVTQKPGQSSFRVQCLNGLCLNVKDPAIWNNTTAWVAAKLPQSALKTKAKILGNPRYIIEYIGDKTSQDSLSVGGEYGTNKDVSTKPIYRITGKSQGETGAKESVIQTTVY
ncbi:MAG: pilus assembly protein, partial [Gammaproteobacteria bacterium]|nr:pilus assembly protein [Gammaproteobacteria bacterium]